MEELGTGHWLWRIAATLVGGLLLYAAVFLYPKERRELHNRLEDWWLRLDETSGQAIKGHMAFVRRIAETAHQGFEWLFGAPLSTRFFIASGLLSMASFAVGMLTFGDYGWAVPTGLALFLVGIVVLALWIGRGQDRFLEEIERRHIDRLVDLYDLKQPHRPPINPLGQSQNHSLYTAGIHAPLQPFEVKKSWWEDLLEQLPNSLLPLVFLGLSGSSLSLVFAGASDKGVGADLFIMAVLTAFTCDCICLLVTMVVLEKIAEGRNPFVAAGLLLIDATIAAAMLVLPWAAFLWVAEPDGKAAHYLIFVAAANISTAVPSLVLLLVAFMTLTHRLFWPLVLRPFYNLIHAEKITRPKTMGAAGLACLSVWIDLPESLRPYLDKLLGLL